MKSVSFSYLSSVYPSWFQESNKPTSGKLEEMWCSWPQWQTAMKMAQRCMASLYIGESHRGMGVFTKPDELLIPRHLINPGDGFICGVALKKLIDSIRIRYSDDRYCYEPLKVFNVVEDGFEKDYCIIKLAGKFPCSVPQVTFNSHHNQCLFAEILENGQIMVSIVSPCSQSPELMCGSVLNWTRPGSCGGIYLDLSGQLIAIHLSQATGLCHAHTGEERKFLYAHEILRSSPVFCHLNQNYSNQPVCLTPVLSDSCYSQQSDVRVKTLIDKQGYYCEGREQHITRAERGLQIDLKQVIQDKKTRKHTTNQVANVFYQVFLEDSQGRERPNIHNSKGSPSSYTNQTAPAFYQRMIQVYHNNIYTLGVRTDEFSFDFKEHSFIARRSQINI